MCTALGQQQRRVFSSTHGTFCKTNHTLGNKTSLSTCEWITVIRSRLHIHKRITVDINNGGKSKNSQKCGNLTTYSYLAKWIKGEIMKQIRKYFEMTDFTGKLPTKSPKHTDAKTLHKIPANQIQQRQGPSKIYPRNAWLSLLPKFNQCSTPSW